MLLQRFASPHSTHSQKTTNDGVASSAVARSTSPTTATSLSTPSPTPVPFLFLLESQESWDTDNTSIGKSADEPCAPPATLQSCTSDDYASRLYATFTVPATATPHIINNALSTTVTTVNNYTNNANANNNYNNNLVILEEVGNYEKGRKIGGEFQKEKSEIEGWIVGGEVGIGAGGGVCSVSRLRDCSTAGGGGGGAAATAAIGGGFGRFDSTTSRAAAAGASTTSSGTGDSRIGGAVAASSAAAATAAAHARLEGQGVAMRYYRLWIYACNIVLLGSAVGFAAAVARTLIFSGDPRRYLVPGVPRAFDFTALYAYLALATQLGLVQLLGCIAARRLSASLLNAYWVLLLALLFGDAVIGVAWVFRFERMRAELRPSLRLRLQLDYGKDARFTEQWDRLQRDFSCCGMSGHEDFESVSPLVRLPVTCCPVNGLIMINSNDTENSQTVVQCLQPHPRGCEDSLVDWLRKTADLLFVLGFCVIAFAKLCFLGILRYEIREMIQKIRLLQEPPPPPQSSILGGSILATSPPFVQSYSQLGVSPIVDPILTNVSTHNNNIINNNNNNNNHNNNNNNSCAGSGAVGRRTTLPMAALPSGKS